MHIKSIIIEGFKSYAHRTEINGFDPLFNAITGLNGSGKSNILDSICFLLGISNLSHVSVLLAVRSLSCAALNTHVVDLKLITLHSCDVKYFCRLTPKQSPS